MSPLDAETIIKQFELEINQIQSNPLNSQNEKVKKINAVFQNYVNSSNLDDSNRQILETLKNTSIESVELPSPLSNDKPANSDLPNLEQTAQSALDVFTEKFGSAWNRLKSIFSQTEPSSSEPLDQSPNSPTGVEEESSHTSAESPKTLHDQIGERLDSLNKKQKPSIQDLEILTNDLTNLPLSMTLEEKSDLINQAIDAFVHMQILYEDSDKNFSSSIETLSETLTELKETLKNPSGLLASPRISFKDRALEFTEGSVPRKIYELMSKKKEFSGVRDVKGDGDCYYRSVMLGLFEQIIQNNNRSRFKEIAKIIKNSPIQCNGKDLLIEKLNQASEYLIWNTVDSLVDELNDRSTDLDVSICLVARHLCSQWVTENADTPLPNQENVPMGAEEKVPTIREIFNWSDPPLSIEAYKTLIEDPKCDAREAIVSLGALGRILRFRLTTFAIDRSQSDIIQDLAKSEQESSGVDQNEWVSVLNTSGHYNILYRS